MSKNNSLNDEEIKPINAVTLFQLWVAKNPIPIGTKFVIENQDKTITLIQCEGYPKGKFIYDDGEAFDIAANAESKFLRLNEKEERKASIYNENLWDEVDRTHNKEKDIDDEKKPIIIETLGATQKNESYHDFAFYDVTKILENLATMADEADSYNLQSEFNKLFMYMANNDYPILTKETIYYIFTSCLFEQTNNSSIYKIKEKTAGNFIGYLIEENEKYMFAPVNKSIGNEYTYENDKALGFFYTADSYLDIALETIKSDKEKFVPLHHSDPDKNNDDYGYHASATIKTLLAFSCECYLKSMLLHDGKKIDDVKKMGHGLTVLYTSLDDNLIARVFSLMEKSGYKLKSSMFEPTYEANYLTDKFMLDLARNDDAFVDARFSAESEKNTNYEFLYQFAIALRKCIDKMYRNTSPFSQSIENNLNSDKKRK